MPHLRVAAAQLAPVFHDRAASVDKACKAIHEAAEGGARLVAFPETFLPGYPYWAVINAPTQSNTFSQELYREAVEVPGPATEQLCAAARDAGIHVTMGLTERDGGTLYNAQLFIDDDGAIFGKRRKLVPTSHERMVWGRGDGRDLQVWDTPLGRLGGLICYEHSNALFRYALQSQREQIHVANWPGGMRSINPIIDAAMRHYGFESQGFVISVTSILTEEVIAAMGDSAKESLSVGGGFSQIIGPRGDVLAKASEDEEEIVYADLDFSLIDRMKSIVDSAGHYTRPDVVRLQLDRRPKNPLEIIED